MGYKLPSVLKVFNFVSMDSNFYFFGEFQVVPIAIIEILHMYFLVSNNPRLYGHGHFQKAIIIIIIQIAMGTHA